MKQRHLMLFFLTGFSMMITSGPSFGSTAKIYPAVVKKINYSKNQHGIIMEFSRKVPCETVQVDSDQILIAIKHATAPETLPAFKKDEVIKHISTDSLPGDIVALVISTHNKIEQVSSNWLPDGKTLLVTLKNN